MLSCAGARILGLAPGKAWCGSWANGPVMPSLHLPTYFELKEIGTNFRYETDPDWVIDVIHQDCVREEGLTSVAEAATYSVTFFQLVNYCSRRGYEVTAFGVHNHDSGLSRSGKRWVCVSGVCKRSTKGTHVVVGSIVNTVAKSHEKTLNVK